MLASRVAEGHAWPTPIPVPPFRVQGNTLIDANRQPFLLRGVQIPGLQAANPSPSDLEAIRAMTPLTFRVIQQRWNMNAVRLPVSSALWLLEGDGYFHRIAPIVNAANQGGLVVVLAAFQDGDAGLPSTDMAGFWLACAAFFKDNPRVIFDVFNQPSTRNIPGSNPLERRPEDWSFWRDGGVLADGQAAVGMQALADAIRSTGAGQIIAVSCFHDLLDFQNFGPGAYIRDPNILYEVHPYYHHGLTEAALNANFGALAARFPVYAGEWGMPLNTSQNACQAVPPDPFEAASLVFRSMAYFDAHNISWTASDFRPGGLIGDFADYTPTYLDRPWVCGETATPQPGIGGSLLLWMTGDPAGFGSIATDQIASAAGGPPRPVSPGQIIAIHGQLVGPENPVPAQLDSAGGVSTFLADTQVFFDGIPAPILLAGYFQVNVQVPYELAGQPTTTVQLVYRGISSNRIQLTLVDAAPGIFTKAGSLTEAAAQNEDGSANSVALAASRGSLVTLLVTGEGRTVPASSTGVPARPPLPRPLLPVAVSIAGKPAEFISAQAAPSLVGVVEVIVRVPPDLTLGSGSQRVNIIVNIGDRSSRPEVVIWVK